MTADENAITSLEKSIIRQVEFYFGDYNLHRDKFMKEHMSKDEGWFSMDIMLKFQRLSSLCSEPGTILASLKKSKSKLIDVDIEEQRIRRKPSRPVPENDEKYRQDLKKRTVYIKGFPQTETIEKITEFLEDYGQIEGVFLRKFTNPHTGSIFKGSLFATFHKLEDANKFLEAPMVYYADQELEKKSKDEFWKEKEKEHGEKMDNKRKKHVERSKSSNKEKAPVENQEDEFSFVQVQNLEDQTISHIDIKEFLRDLGSIDCKFFSRYEKNGPTGYILFAEKETADHMMTLLKDISEDNSALIKSTRIQFSIPSEEERKQALACYQDFRGLNKEGKKFGNRFGHKKRQFQGKRNDGQGKRFKAEE